MAEIRPFKIDISDEKLAHLKQKLSLTRFPGEIEDTNWDYGVPLKDVKRLAKYWQDGYDWRKHEAKLNEFKHFKTNITVDGFPEIDLHFIHEKSSVKGAIPLLFVHGWPGSFLEVTKILPLLTNPKNGEPAFHIIAPSLPNFGFSSGVYKKGFALVEQAHALNKLMIALGYNEYAAQGGDIGFAVTRTLAILYPENVKVVHTNMAMFNMPAFTYSPVHAATSMLKFAGQIPYVGALIPASMKYSESDLLGLERAKDWAQGQGRGYFGMLSTVPQTMSYSLDDSPVGLLSFVYEKLTVWSHDYPWTDDEVLTWMSIYWFSTAGPGASTYIYKENAKQSAPDGTLPRTTLLGPVQTPYGVSYFPKELLNMPKSWASGAGNVVFMGEHDSGGHFAAYENPEGLAKDLKTMFGKGGGGFGLVPGSDGY